MVAHLFTVGHILGESWYSNQCVHFLRREPSPRSFAERPHALHRNGEDVWGVRRYISALIRRNTRSIERHPTLNKPTGWKMSVTFMNEPRPWHKVLARSAHALHRNGEQHMWVVRLHIGPQGFHRISLRLSSTASSELRARAARLLNDKITYVHVSTRSNLYSILNRRQSYLRWQKQRRPLLRSSTYRGNNVKKGKNWPISLQVS